MPMIAIVDGVRIVIYLNDHLPPHFHAWKDGRDAMFEIETGRQLMGSLDRRAIRKVKEWTESHRDLLMTAWSTAQTGSTETTKS